MVAPFSADAGIAAPAPDASASWPFSSWFLARRSVPIAASASPTAFAYVALALVALCRALAHSALARAYLLKIPGTASAMALDEP